MIISEGPTLHMQNVVTDSDWSGNDKDDIKYHNH